MADKDKEKEKEKPAKQPKAAPTGAQAKAIEKGKAEAASKKGPKVEGGEQVAPKSLRLRDKYRAEIIPAERQLLLPRRRWGVEQGIS